MKQNVLNIITTQLKYTQYIYIDTQKKFKSDWS